MSTEPTNLSIAALSRDVFFGMRIRTVLRNLGYNMVLCKNESELVQQSESVALVLVDFNMPVAWSEIDEVLKGPVPVIAFGAHTNVEGFKTAKSSGATRVISNGEFTRKLPNLLAQYLKA
ncbi:MAG: hypothetical protein KC435_11975 [Thermomicrobiales bacterium]|nr:hypothetical protein [Thermomicrobiales bacterium]